MVYLLPFLAVLLSFMLVLTFKPKNTDILKLLLAFSGAFLLALTIFELLPEVYQHGNPKQMGVFVIIGILLQIFLEFFSKGAEHGHVHHEKKQEGLPILLLASLCLHAFVEGFSIKDHNNMLYGVLVHKVPVAIIVGLFLINSKVRMATAFLAMGIFAIMTPLGNYLSENLP
ncbi:MAG: ZIP family metal transporter, partial [Flavobacteriaceae bacterium]